MILSAITRSTSHPANPDGNGSTRIAPALLFLAGVIENEGQRQPYHHQDVENMPYAHNVE